jgi:hypothetical protein
VVRTDRKVGGSLILTGFLCVVYDKDFNRSLGSLQFQPELLLQSCKDRRPCDRIGRCLFS